MSPSILIEEDNNILTLTINRPNAKNALTQEAYKILAQRLEQAAHQAKLQAIIITGAGPYFCAGNDLHDFMSREFTLDNEALRFLKALHQLEIPVIAAVEGGAVGIGVTLLLHCDFVIATHNGQFSTPFTALGLCPEGASSVLLSQYVGIRKANEWLLLGKSFSSQEVLAQGLINQVVEIGESLNTAKVLAKQFSQYPLYALKASKQLLKNKDQLSILASMGKEMKLFIECLQQEQTQHNFKKFFQKKSTT